MRRFWALGVGRLAPHDGGRKALLAMLNDPQHSRERRRLHPYRNPPIEEAEGPTPMPWLGLRH
eukprot:2620729-Alexandrium_andersonii.AAC.1